VVGGAACKTISGEGPSTKFGGGGKPGGIGGGPEKN